MNASAALSLAPAKPVAREGKPAPADEGGEPGRKAEGGGFSKEFAGAADREETRRRESAAEASRKDRLKEKSADGRRPDATSGATSDAARLEEHGDRASGQARDVDSSKLTSEKTAGDGDAPEPAARGDETADDPVRVAAGEEPEALIEPLVPPPVDSDAAVKPDKPPETTQEASSAAPIVRPPVEGEENVPVQEGEPGEARPADAADAGKTAVDAQTASAAKGDGALEKTERQASAASVAPGRVSTGGAAESVEGETHADDMSADGEKSVEEKRPVEDRQAARASASLLDAQQLKALQSLASQGAGPGVALGGQKEGAMLDATIEGALAQIGQGATHAAPAGAAGSSVSVAHGAAASGGEAVRQIVAAVRGEPGASVIDVRLDPPDLGRVRIQFAFDGGDTVAATVSSDRSDTLDLLRRHTSDLIRQLEQAGFENISLDFTAGEQAPAYEDEAQTGAENVGLDEAGGKTTVPHIVYLSLRDGARLDRLV